MKKMNNWLLLLFAAAVMFSCQSAQKEASEEESAETESAAEAPADNTLTAEESADGWQLLFDGETSNGWRGYKKER